MCHNILGSTVLIPKTLQGREGYRLNVACRWLSCSLSVHFSEKIDKNIKII